MKIAVITGSSGLVGSEAAQFLSRKFDKIIGIDNDFRKRFFGDDATTLWNKKRLEKTLPNFTHETLDIRDGEKINNLFRKYGRDIRLVVHTAAQPSHDWAAKEPETDFTVNANGTLCLLEAVRRFAPEAVFIFTSTNKVYGDTPNFLPLVEKETRWEIKESHVYSRNGIDESMSIDNSKHSLFGVSKLAADVLAQEYGKYFGLKTGIFRCGCVTGPKHSGTQLHGFLSYLMKCAITGEKYTIFGYQGKQVRDNIHSQDLVSMFWYFYENPKPGEVYNAGGSRFFNCSMLEAIAFCEKITGRKMSTAYSDTPRVGDHIWWISDVSKFKKNYPQWTLQHNLESTLLQIHDSMRERVGAAP